MRWMRDIEMLLQFPKLLSSWAILGNSGIPTSDHFCGINWPSQPPEANTIARRLHCSLNVLSPTSIWTSTGKHNLPTNIGEYILCSVTCTRSILTNSLITSTVVPLNLKLFCQCDGRSCVVEATICRTIHQQMRRPGYGPTH